MTAMLAKFYNISVKLHWPTVIAVLLATVIMGGLIIWFGSKKSV